MCLVCVRSDKKQEDDCEGVIRPFITFSQLVAEIKNSGEKMISIFRDGIIDAPEISSMKIGKTQLKLI